MNRTRRYQLFYVLAVLILAACALAVYLWIGVAGLLAFALVLLIPGRIGGRCLANLFLGRKLFDQRRFNEAIDAGNAFLADLRHGPWRRHFIYCHYAFYTWDVEAMACNNIGAARMELGEIDQAERDLAFALQKDTDYPLPYFNLAVIAYVRGDAAEGDRLVSVAAEKGYSGGSIDKLITSVGAAYARVQSQTRPSTRSG